MSQTGYTPILNYASGTASAVPSAANLTSSASGAELAVNYADGKLFYKDSGGVVQVLATKATGSIGGSTTQVQFNNAGALGGSASLTWNGTVLTSSGFAGPLNGTVGATTPAAGSFTTLSATGNVTLSALTSGRVTYATTAGLLTDSANLTFNGTTLTSAFAGPHNGTVGASTPATGAFTNLSYTGTLTGGTGVVNIGSGQIYKDASGNVGIGTSSPTDGLLHLNGGSTTNVKFTNATTGTTSGDGLFVGLASSADTDGYFFNRESANIKFGTANTERMRIDSSGNVGIGTSSPVTKLEVKGAGFVAISVSGDSTSEAQLRFNTNTSARIVQQSNQPLIFDTNNTERMRIDSSGNVGIGTDSPSGRFRVQGSTSDSSANTILATNSSATSLFFVRNDGYTNTGLAAVSPYNYSTSGRIAYLDSFGGFGYLASIRAAKTNIESLNIASWVYNLNPVQFNYRKKNELNQFTDDFAVEKHYGLIAEEVESINKELCFYDADGTLRGVSYDKLTSVLLKAIQEQQALITSLTARIEALETK